MLVEEMCILKRTFTFVGVFIMLLILNGCNVKRLSMEQSQNNFADYENQLKEVLEPYGLTMSELSTEQDEIRLYRSFLIALDDTTTVTVYFSSNATQDRNGREEVEIIYYNNDGKIFDLNLFTKIVNSVSGREISENYCEQFLSDPEEKHLPSRYGIDKTDSQKIYKYEFLNFGEDWSIGYSLYDDETEELTFWGLTKQLK